MSANIYGTINTLNHGVLHLGIFAKYAAAFFKNATSSSRRIFSRLRRANSACWSFFSSRGWLVCRSFDRHEYNIDSESPKSMATMGIPSRSARSKTCSLNWTVYLLRITEVVDSFFNFIIDLWFKDYSLNRVSDSSGQDQSLVYELTRQNQGILIDLKEADKTIAQLTLEQCVLKDGHLELLMRLAKANEQIDQLTVKLADAHSEIARLSVVLQNNNT